MRMRERNPQRHEPDSVTALAKRLHLVDEPKGEPSSIGWDGLLEDTRQRYMAYAEVALTYTEHI